MPRQAPANAEPILLSQEDADLAESFVFRRSFNTDGTLRYVQIAGPAAAIEAAAKRKPDAIKHPEPDATVVVSLPRLIAQRMLGRPLKSNEVAQPKNGKNGDNRRENITVTTRSKIASRERTGRASTGSKYVYPNGSGRYYLNFRNVYLGTYDTPAEAQKGLEQYLQFLEEGLDQTAAARRTKIRARNSTKVIIQD